MNHMPTLLALFLCLSSLPACEDAGGRTDRPEVSLSFKPDLLPIKITISTSGRLTVSLDYSVSIPTVGRISLSGGFPVIAQPKDPDELLIVVRTADAYEYYHARRGDKNKIVIDIACPSKITVDPNRNRVDVDVSSCIPAPGRADLTSPATNHNPQGSCDESAISCANYSYGDRHGWHLNDAAYHARQAGRLDEGICAARRVVNETQTDQLLLGAANFELASAWHSKGCNDRAYDYVTRSLRARPYKGKGWSTTCDLCRELKRGSCAGCE